MTGKHRGSVVLSWRLFMSSLAAAFGRGYLGTHRVTALGLPLVPPMEHTFSLDLRPLEAPLARPAWVDTRVGQAQLAIVPVPHRADPLLDTMPHPVVKLFPLPVDPPTVDVREVVLDGPIPLAADPGLRAVAG
ncbi:MAG: hypothetical protein ACRC0L_05540 [Angustibacter sp.]